MVANLVFAIGVIATLALFTVLGKIPMPVGVIGHEGSTLLVVANSLRLFAHREP
jgi:Cd2+/Zn2+-exporting ATPase